MAAPLCDVYVCHDGGGAWSRGCIPSIRVCDIAIAEAAADWASLRIGRQQRSFELTPRHMRLTFRVYDSVTLAGRIRSSERLEEFSFTVPAEGQSLVAFLEALPTAQRLRLLVLHFHRSLTTDEESALLHCLSGCRGLRALSLSFSRGRESSVSAVADGLPFMASLEFLRVFGLASREVCLELCAGVQCMKHLRDWAPAVALRWLWKSSW